MRNVSQTLLITFAVNATLSSPLDGDLVSMTTTTTDIRTQGYYWVLFSRDKFGVLNYIDQITTDFTQYFHDN